MSGYVPGHLPQPISIGLPIKPDDIAVFFGNHGSPKADAVSPDSKMWLWAKKDLDKESCGKVICRAIPLPIASDVAPLGFPDL